MKAAIRILRQCFFQPDDSLREIFARRDIGFESCRAVWFGSRLARERGKVRVISASRLRRAGTPHLHPLPLDKGRDEKSTAAALLSSPARRDTEGLFNRRRVVNFPALDYSSDVVDVPDVFRRVAIHENHVSQFPRGND